MLSSLIGPSGMAYALLAVGFIAVLWRRTRHLATWLFAASASITVIFSSGIAASILISPLEYAHPVLQDAAKFTNARHIVVLTGWASDDPLMPLSGKLNSASAYRVLLALELHRERPDCDIIVSGEAKTARIMGEVLVKLGVPAEQLRLENKSNSTAESAALLAPLVGNDEFFLVTSAGHLPRSLRAIHRRGLRPIAAPTDYRAPKDWMRALASPSPSALVASDLAVHEYAGMLWYRLRGWL